MHRSNNASAVQWSSREPLNSGYFCKRRQDVDPTNRCVIRRTSFDLSWPYHDSRHADSTIVRMTLLFPVSSGKAVRMWAGDCRSIVACKDNECVGIKSAIFKAVDQATKMKVHLGYVAMVSLKCRNAWIVSARLTFFRILDGKLRCAGNWFVRLVVRHE